MTSYALLFLMMGCFLFQTTDESIIAPSWSSNAEVDASIQVKLLEQRLPGSVFSILLKFKNEALLSSFILDEKYISEWELLPAGNASKTQNEGKTIQTIPFILRAKKTGAINIPNLKASVLLDTKDTTLVWKNWLLPEKLFPFKELDTLKRNNGPIIDTNSPWIAIGLLLLIALGVLVLIKKKLTLVPSELNVTKELENWLKKVDALTLEECITTLEPLLREAISKQADIVASQELESPIANELTPSQRLMFGKALQAIENIKYSKNKDRVTLISTIHELTKTL